MAVILLFSGNVRHRINRKRGKTPRNTNLDLKKEEDFSYISIIHIWESHNLFWKWFTCRLNLSLINFLLIHIWVCLSLWVLHILPYYICNKTLLQTAYIFIQYLFLYSEVVLLIVSVIVKYIKTYSYYCYFPSDFYFTLFLLLLIV